MPTCKEITELATGSLEGALDPATRRGVEQHLAGCPGCRTWLEQLDVARRAVGSLPPPQLPGHLREQLMGQLDARLAARGRAVEPVRAAAGPEGPGQFAWEALLALAAVVALLAGLAHHPSRAPGDLAVASGLAAGAIALGLLARRLTLRLAAVAVSAALVAAMVRGGPGPLAALMGLECLVTEAAAAVAVAGAAWLAFRRGARSGRRGAWLVVGALGGDAALQVACAGQTSLPHLLAFHAGGVLAAAAVALVAGRRHRLA
jgi:hypothetical protein